MRVKTTLKEVHVFDDEDAGTGRAELELVVGDHDDQEAFMTIVTISVPIELKASTSIEGIRQTATTLAIEAIQDILEQGIQISN